MITKQLIKDEIDNVAAEHLPVLYRLVLALEESPAAEIRESKGQRFEEKASGDGWADFIAETYGCLAVSPIERGDQGRYESREDLA